MQERNRLVDTWIAAVAEQRGQPRYEANRRALETLDRHVHERPEEAWEVILAILARAAADGRVVGILAAGPLEDLLVSHGPAFIDRVEERAQIDSDFKPLLGSVYQNRMPNDFWALVVT